MTMADKESNRKRRDRVRAAALSYKPGSDNAPQVVARGEGKIAEQIIALAREHGVPITEDPDLVEILSKMDVGEEISPDLYKVVAELLVFVYRLKQRWGELQKSQ